MFTNLYAVIYTLARFYISQPLTTPSSHNPHPLAQNFNQGISDNCASAEGVFFFFLFSSGSSECNVFFEEIRWSKSTKLCALPARWRGTTYNLPCVSLCVCARVCVDYPNFVVDHEGKSILLSRSHQHLAQQKTFPGAFCHGSILIVLAALDCEQTQKEDCSSHSHNYKKIRGIPQIHCMTTTGEASWVRLLCRTKESQTKMSRAFVPPSLREMSQHADLCSYFYRIKWQKNKNDRLVL